MLPIAVINKSTAISDTYVQTMLPVLSQQWNVHLQPIWGVGDANVTFVPKHQSHAGATWWAVVLNDSDQAETLAYHHLTNDGLPVSKVFVKTILADEASVSVG